MPAASQLIQLAAAAAAQMGASIGQLRWQPGSSSNRLEPPKPQQGQDAATAPGLSPDDLIAAATAATTPDVFKQGDCIGPGHEGQGRYKLLYKLGRGPGGQAEGLGDGRFVTVWAVQDRATDKQVVVKVVEAGDATSYTAGTREAALHAMSGRHSNIVPLLDAFEHRSGSGRHAALVTERCGSSLDFVVQAYSLGTALEQSGAGRQVAMASAVELPQLQDARALRHIAKQTLQGLAHLHSRGIVHMDVSADNIVLDKLFAWHNKHSLSGLLRNAWQDWSQWLGNLVRKDAAQEVLGLEYVGPAYDVWHFGCLMFELATGVGLLDQFDYNGIMELIPKAARKYYGDNDCYLLEMTSVFGNLPKNLLHKSPLYKGFYMEQDDSLKVARYVGVPGGVGGRSVPRLLKKECDGLQEQEINQFGKFLVDVLEVDPDKRPTADKLLQHVWLQDDA
eukprot:gene7713-7912_t